MGRDTYRFAGLDDDREKRKKLDPIWRGVGCLIIVFIVVFGYLLATWFIRENSIQNWIFIPAEAYNPQIHPLIDRYIGRGILVRLTITFLLMIFSFGIMTSIYSIAFPVQPKEMDVGPPSRRKARRWKNKR